MDINLSRPVHFAGLESGVLAAFQALISRWRREGREEAVIKKYGSFCDDANYSVAELALSEKRKEGFIYIYIL